MRPANLFVKELSAAFLTALLLGLFAPGSRAHAQTGAPGPVASSAAPAPANTPNTLSVDARLVNLPVVVRDKKGALVQNLTKEDFSLQVDGHPQVIRYFDKDTNLPLDRK